MNDDRPQHDETGAKTAAAEAVFPDPVSTVAPGGEAAPLVLASPHSGRDYPACFRASSRLSALDLRRSEDAFVDLLIADAPAHGAWMVHARYPRAFCDVNREPYELDPAMFADPLPDYVNTASLRVANGLGTIARIVADGAEIYRRPLTFAEAEARIEGIYRPYHAALSAAIGRVLARWGHCILLDCHSMPAVVHYGDGERAENADMVIGDRYGSSCTRDLSDFAEMSLRRLGFSTARNRPYAGGFTTCYYSRPPQVQVLQVEINRRLYMDEGRIAPHEGFDDIRRCLGRFIAALSDYACQQRSRAAE